MSEAGAAVDERRMEAVGRLAAVVGHEFGDILTVVMCNLESLVEAGGPARSDLTEEAEDIRRALRTGADRIAELMCIAGERRQSREAVDLVKLVRGATPTLESLLPGEARLRIEVPAGASCMVRADRAALHQILLDLVSNAAAAIHEGGEIVVAVGLSSDGGAAEVDRVHLRVADTGVGMDTETRERIFDPFFTTAENGASEGLGLSITHALVRCLGGTISVDSRPGVGTAVEVSLPRGPRDALEPRGAPTSGRPGPPAPACAPGPILVVEPDPIIRRSIRRALARSGFEVVCSIDGGEALSFLERHGPSVALLVADPSSPGVRADALREAARGMGLATRFLFMSGCPVGPRGTRPPDVGFLRKPCSASELVAHIRWMLTRTPAVRAGS